jgi:hypothetical protein
MIRRRFSSGVKTLLASHCNKMCNLKFVGFPAFTQQKKKTDTSLDALVRSTNKIKLLCQKGMKCGI